MTLSALAEQLDGDLIGTDLEFSRLSTDTRTLSSGDIYLALVGEHFDGNNFVEQAKDNGACAAIVSRSVECDLPMLQVADTHIALAQLASVNRSRSQARVIALTGSQGKTTVKEMLGAILSHKADTLITEANLNNTIGVPLTLLQLAEHHSYAVVEMGADKAGEISFSSRAAQPDIALITNASAAHIEGFGSLEAIVRAKGEIVEGLAEEGVLILNADDEHVDDWLQMAEGRRIVRFSAENQCGNADCFASDLAINHSGQASFKLVTALGNCDISMQLLGKHNVLNAVAATAAAIEAGAELSDVEYGLSSMRPIHGRLCPMRGINQCLLIDDTYNASPTSFAAAIDVLVSFPGRKILLAGEMKELGAESESAHAQVGRYAAATAVDELWAVGDQCRLMVKAFGERGRHFEAKSELASACREIADSAVTFLVKGSRGARMDTLVSELIQGEDI